MIGFTNKKDAYTSDTKNADTKWELWRNILKGNKRKKGHDLYYHFPTSKT